MKVTKDLLNKKDLLEALDLTDFAEDQASTLFELLMDILEIKMLDTILSELEDADKKEFITLLNKEEDPEAVNDFLRDHIKGFDSKLKIMMAEFKQELKEDIAQAKKSLLKN